MSGERCCSGGCRWLGVEPFAQNVEVDAEASEQPRGLLVARERPQQVAQAEPCAPPIERDPGACHQQPLRHRFSKCLLSPWFRRAMPLSSNLAASAQSAAE